MQNIYQKVVGGRVDTEGLVWLKLKLCFPSPDTLPPCDLSITEDTTTSYLYGQSTVCGSPNADLSISFPRPATFKADSSPVTPL